jgi:hypothetical protein
MTPSEKTIQERIKHVLPTLNEIQRRLYLGAEAKSIGRGGKSKISALSGVRRSSISRGIKEIEDLIPVPKKGVIRQKGGGRKKETSKQQPD